MSKSLALFAFESLVSKLKSSPSTSFRELELSESESSKYPKKAPLFVTWLKKGDLRGCIGTFLAMPVEEGVYNYALVSAFEDTRFTPIKISELPFLSVSITLLDKFEEIYDPQQWVIGKHGLKILLVQLGHHYLGTFLPLVAEEQNWNCIETLWNLLRKAGFVGVSPVEVVKFYTSSIAAGSMKLTRYEGLKCSATFQEYENASMDMQ